MNTQGTSGGLITGVLPGRPFELIDRFGMLRGRFATVLEAAEAAKRIWPEQEQDEDRTGKGWDIQVAVRS